MADQKFWTRPEEERIFQRMVDMQDGTHAIQMIAHPPFNLLTNEDTENPRLRVENAQASFFGGREFRLVKDITILSGQQITYRFVSTVDFVVERLDFDLTLSQIRAEFRDDGTPSGDFNTPVQFFNCNQMSTAPDYTSGMTITTGGNHIGGNVYEISVLKSGANVNQATTKAITNNTPVGFAAGTYYLHIQNTDGATSDGVLHIRWEERP